MFYFQDPKQADAMTKIQSELDETKIILVCIPWLLIHIVYNFNINKSHNSPPPP